MTGGQEQERGLEWKSLKRHLRELGYSYTRAAYPRELHVRRMLPNGIVVEGVIGLPGDYPANHPGRAYLVLCHDWDRRANAYVRQFMQADFPAQMRVIEADLALGYDARFGDSHDF